MLSGFELDDMTASVQLGGLTLSEQRRLLDAYKHCAARLLAIDRLHDVLESRRGTPARGALQGLRDRVRGKVA